MSQKCEGIQQDQTRCSTWFVMTYTKSSLFQVVATVTLTYAFKCRHFFLIIVVEIYPKYHPHPNPNTTTSLPMLPHSCNAEVCNLSGVPNQSRRRPTTTHPTHFFSTANISCREKLHLHKFANRCVGNLIPFQIKSYVQTWCASANMQKSLPKSRRLCQSSSIFLV